MARHSMMSLFFIAVIVLSSSPYSIDMSPDTAQINLGLPDEAPLGRNYIFQEFTAPSDTVSAHSIGDSGILYLDSLSIYTIQAETFNLRFLAIFQQYRVGLAGLKVDFTSLFTA